MAKAKLLSYEELEKIKKTFEKMKNDKTKLGLSLIDEALFCGETLASLKDKVREDGVVTIMCQGNYEIERENPALKAYNTTIKNYQNIIKQINDLLDKQPSITVKDELEEFIK